MRTPRPHQLVHQVCLIQMTVTDDDHDIYSPPQPRRRRGDVGSTRGRAMRARGRGRGRGGGKGRGRMRGQGTRGTRRGGRTARSVQANPVDDKWKWLSTYANDSSISSPVLMLKVDHLLKLQTQPWTTWSEKALRTTTRSGVGVLYVHTKDKQPTPRRERTPKQRITVLSVMYMYAMVSVLKNTTHL